VPDAELRNDNNFSCFRSQAEERMRTQIAILIATALTCMASAAWADGRTVAYLAGFAYGVVVQCPGKEMDDTKALPPRSSIRPGGIIEFAEGAAQVVEMFRDPESFGAAKGRGNNM
jgi:hypothetical protein